MCQVGSTWLEAVHPLSKLLKVVRCPFTTEAINSASSSCFFPSAAEVPATCFGVALTPMVQALSCLSCILTRSKAEMDNVLIVAYPHKFNPTIYVDAHLEHQTFSKCAGTHIHAHSEHHKNQEGDVLSVSLRTSKIKKHLTWNISA